MTGRTWHLPVLSLMLLVSAPAAVGQTITATPATAHPTQVATIAGSGFADAEAVDVYIDTTDTLLLVSSATGTLSGSLTLPAGLLPGTHFITTVGRRAGDAAQVAVKITTPWTEFGFGASHRAWNPYENVISTANVATLGPSWYAGSAGTGATPVVNDGTAYMSTLAGLLAVSTSTGATTWTALPGITFYATPTLSGGTLYIGDGSGNFHAINAKTGKTVWSVTLGSQIFGSAAVTGGVVYVGLDNGLVEALSAATGATTWTYQTGAGIDGSPTVVNGVVYVGSFDENFYALNASTGAKLWSYATSGIVESTPAVVNGVLYGGSDDGGLYAIRAAGSSAGTLIWKATTGGPVFDPAVVANGQVFAGSNDGNMYAFDLRTGATEWKFLTPSFPRPAVAANGVLYFTSNDGGLYALAETGGLPLWYGNSGFSYLGGPAVSDGVLYVNAYGDQMTAYAIDAGNQAIARKPTAPAIRDLQPDLSLPETR